MATAETLPNVREYSQEELERRLAEIEREMENHMGSVQRFEERAANWQLNEDERKLFSEYDSVKWLLDR